MKDNRDAINQIKETLDIVNVIERTVKLKKAGKNYLGLCPFHNEKTPSFIVSPDIQRFKCFGCGKSGDIFNFVQEIENIDFPETLKKLADEAGVTIDQPQVNEKYQAINDLNDLANEFFQKSLKSKPSVLEYLHKRGITDESIDRFCIGYSGSYNALLKHIQALPVSKEQKKFTEKDMMDSGLFTEKEGKIRDRFIKRVMFPIRSVSGKIIAYSGRQLPGDDFGPKYLNTPETPVFHKRDTLFGIYESKNTVRKAKYCILCEGQTDVIAAHAAGIDNIVAPLGTGLTESQMELIKRYADNLHFLFDSDTAGQAAVERGFKIAAQFGITTYAASPSPYKDIDELIQADLPLAKKLVKPKTDAFTFLIAAQLQIRDINTQKDYNFLINYANELLSYVKTQVHQDFYIKKFKELTNIELEEVQKTETTASKERTPLTKDFKKPIDTAQIILRNREFNLIAVTIKHNIFSSLIEVNTKFMTEESAIEVIKYVQKLKSLTVQEMLESDDLGTKAKRLLEEISYNLDKFPEREGFDPTKEFADVYNNIKTDYYDREINRLRSELAIAENQGDDEKAEEIQNKVVETLKNLNNKM